ncbi:hypothetical protein D3C76_1283600 [compost metagenome]
MLGIPFVLIVIASAFRLLPRSAIDTYLERFDRIFTSSFNLHGDLAMNCSVIGWTNDLHDWEIGVRIIDCYRVG